MSETTLEITTKIGCANNCKYCPQKIIRAKYNGEQYLTIENFKHILEKIPKEVVLTFSGFAEPFLNPKCSEMIAHAFKKGYKISLFTTLRGCDLSTIKDIKFHNIVIHVADKNMDLKKDFQKYFLAKKYFKNVEFMSFDNSLKNLFGKKVSKGIVNSRAGNLDKVKIKKGKLLCSGWDNPHPVLLPNGDVYLCCMDYNLHHKLGNLIKKSWEHLFTEEWKRIKSFKDEDIICRLCDVAVPATVNNKIKRKIKHHKLFIFFSKIFKMIKD